MKNYEEAVKNFETKDRFYKCLEEQFWSGELLLEIIATRARSAPETGEIGGQVHPSDDDIKDAMTQLKKLLEKTVEERNVACQEARAALREAVVLDQSQQRGPDGKAATVTCGPFKVTSLTYRWFDSESLLRSCAEKGMADELCRAQSFDKDGKVYNICHQVWEVDYPKTLDFLLSRNLRDVLDKAYDEKEGTPKVTGPKPLAFLGDTKDKE